MSLVDSHGPTARGTTESTGGQENQLAKPSEITQAAAHTHLRPHPTSKNEIVFFLYTLYVLV